MTLQPNCDHMFSLSHSHVLLVRDSRTSVAVSALIQGLNTKEVSKAFRPGNLLRQDMSASILDIALLATSFLMAVLPVTKSLVTTGNTFHFPFSL